MHKISCEGLLYAYFDDQGKMVGSYARQPCAGGFDASNLDLRADKGVVNPNKRIHGRPCIEGPGTGKAMLGIEKRFPKPPVYGRAGPCIEITADDKRRLAGRMSQPIRTKECLGLGQAFTAVKPQMSIDDLDISVVDADRAS